MGPEKQYKTKITSKAFPLVFRAPVGVGEERRNFRRRAQRASLTDFARLFERSDAGAKRVPREPEIPSTAADPFALAKGRRLRVAFLCLLSLAKQRK
jgi:hypothetical protein